MKIGLYTKWILPDTNAQQLKTHKWLQLFINLHSSQIQLSQDPIVDHIMTFLEMVFLLCGKMDIPLFHRIGKYKK